MPDMKLLPRPALGLSLALLSIGVATASPPQPLQTIKQLPIKEVTIFKDGHAFVLHQGKLPVTPQGEIVMDYLPSPVLGTFWPYSADKEATLRSVTAGKQKTLINRTALTMREMIEANLGASVVITEKPATATSPTTPPSYQATLLEIPTRSSEELNATNPSAPPNELPVKSNIVMVKTVHGIKALSFERILDITFEKKQNDKVANEKLRNLLSLDLSWKSKPRPQAEVGMIYLQRGLRWIPSYKVDIDGQGKAVVKLEATLINELANLVIGVPSFAFKGELDPIALQKNVGQLSSHFNQNSATAYGFSNAIMSQTSMQRPQGSRHGGSGASAPMNLGPEITGGQKNEDLFMFTVKHLTLKKGERMVIPITEYKLDYTDVYTLNIPFSPPPEVMQNLGSSRLKELTKAFSSPKVKHKIRLNNQSKEPLTTAPALVLKNGKLIAQGMMTYTPSGGHVDLALTTAVDISVKKSDQETKRTPNAISWDHHTYTRINLKGAITLTNYKKQPVTLEITRYTLGNIDTVGQNGKTEMVNPLENPSFKPEGGTSSWWSTYSWPWWWYRFNSIGKITWTTTLESNQTTAHTYEWHYFWR